MRGTLLFAACLALLVCACSAGMPHTPGLWRGARAGTLPGPFKPHKETYHKDGLITSTYISPPLPLAAGQVIFTDPSRTMLPFPPGKIAIQSVTAGLADSEGNETPLSEVYNHHWIIMADMQATGNLGPCQGLGYVFGIGAESRHTYPSFPAPYRYLTHGNETWNANIHVIRTTNVPFVKQCIECHCGSVLDPSQGGAFSCCPDGSFCPINATAPTKIYYLKYNVTWEPIQPSHIPLNFYVFDASNCNIEYNVPQCTGGACVSSLTETFTFPYAVDVVFVAGHLHVGAINGTFINTNTGATICNTYPLYGNGTEPGNESGYVVKLTPCTFNQPLHLPAGTTVSFTGTYTNDPYRDAVMTLVYVAVVAPSFYANGGVIADNIIVETA